MKTILRIRFLAMGLLALLAAGCGDNRHFTVEGSLAGKETQSLHFYYYADGAVHAIPGAARDGKFKIQGSSSQPTILDILSNDGNVVGRVYVSNGQTIKCELDRLHPWKIRLEGSPENERWAGFIRANEAVFSKQDSAGINKAIASYISAHPDDIVGALLLASSYDSRRDPAGAASLLESLAPEVRPQSIVGPLTTMLGGIAARPDSIDSFRYYLVRDTLRRFDRHNAALSLLSFTDSPDGNVRPDSLTGRLRSLRKRYSASRLGVYDFSFCTDSFTWHRSVRPDSARWVQGWLPAQAATEGLENAAIVSLPWFVVADSAGLIHYRGTSVSEAERTIDNILK